MVLADDQSQHDMAVRVLNQPCWIGVTVSLELWWVLTRVARLRPEAAAAAFTELRLLSAATWQHGEAVAWAANKAAAGADFADMLHLALSGGADRFTTFDKAIAAHADGAPVPVETL
jgi:predicted nucleic-acid-binding protein